MKPIISQFYSINIDENNIFIIQKLLYYFEINNILKNNDNKSDFILHGIIDVCGKKEMFLIPKYSFNFPYKDEIILYEYKKEQKSEQDRGSIIRMENIIISCFNLTILKDFIHEISNSEFLVMQNRLIKYIWRDSFWKYCNKFKQRYLDTLYLPENEKNRVITTIEKFYDKSNTIYNDLCIPQKKIFLFWGIPGSGKTTFIRAIASHFNKNIAIIKNTLEIDDNMLELMLEELPKNSIVLFEDIDSLFQGRSNVANTRITFSGLLNFLDGIIDYDKLLVFITTNNIHYLDDALKRRIDIYMEFTYMRQTEIINMFNKYFKEKYIAKDFCSKLKSEVTPNALEKYFIKCISESLSPLENIDLLSSYIEFTKTSDMNKMYM
jgi:AAA+ superfamily predicted ATPase